MKTLLLNIVLLFSSNLVNAININEFYQIFSSGSLSEINMYINTLDSEEQTPIISAYKGALLMKKAGLEKTPIEKINTFKQGHKLLEAEIANEPNNIEFRFLRLVIQENAPIILKYNKNLTEDKLIIVNGFRNLGPTMQQEIEQYSKHSKILTEKDIQ